jgi:hypothetical protein
MGAELEWGCGKSGQVLLELLVALGDALLIGVGVLGEIAM